MPDAMRVGDVNSGFGVILTVLGNERSITTRAPKRGGGVGPFERIVGVAREFGDLSDPHHPAAPRPGLQLDADPGADERPVAGVAEAR